MQFHLHALACNENQKTLEESHDSFHSTVGATLGVVSGYFLLYRPTNLSLAVIFIGHYSPRYLAPLFPWFAYSPRCGR
jgi:hypothetical protein